jgi:3-phosphoshikimate 1-carboxyvinyltransferase
MALPSLIEIQPLSQPVTACVTVPGSKSITNRALLLAALAPGETILEGALWSEDTQVMVECLQELGYMVTLRPDAEEACNREITIYGLDGRVPRGGTADQPLELFVGNAGTAARFLAALVCLGEGVYRLHGVPRMHERPQAALFGALRELGYRVDSPNDRLPVLIHGGGARRAFCRVSVAESSQFASALLLGAVSGQWQVAIEGDNEDELPYVEMTRRLIEMFPRAGGRFRIEPDASGGGYFLAVNQLPLPGAASGHRVAVMGWPQSGWQIDADFPKYLPLPSTLSRSVHLGDSIMMAIVLAPLASQAVRFTDLGRLRVQECERVQALRTELSRCGARVVEEDDALLVAPSPLRGAEIETYHDHRMAMCFAILGLKVPGLRIKNPACVRKTFPSFFQKLATAPPDGLGAGILDCARGRRLEGDELLSE